MAVARYTSFWMPPGNFPVPGPNPSGNLALFAYKPGGWKGQRWPQTFPPAVPPDEYKPIGPPVRMRPGYAGLGAYGAFDLSAFISTVGSKIGSSGSTVLSALKNMDPEDATKWIDTVGQGYLTVSEIRRNVRSANSPRGRRRGRGRRRRPAAPAPDPRVDEIQNQIAQLSQAMQAQAAAAQARPATPGWVLPVAAGGVILLAVVLLAGRRRRAPAPRYPAPRA